MFVAIGNTPRPYAWGSATAIPELLGREPSGEPEAELWLGAHPGSPSRILNPSAVGGAADLASWIATDPAALGPTLAPGRLPFLLKILAAGAPLSLQAHPTPEQARLGFQRENEQAVPGDAPHRNYKDEFAKPELIFALSDTFEALCGFRPLASFRELVEAFAKLARGKDVAPLADLLSRTAAENARPDLVAWLTNGGSEVEALVDTVTTVARAASETDAADFPAEFALVRLLADLYPGDPGIVVALLLNHVVISRGEALYLPAGNIHAYLSGLGVELMAASDNVIRGGLTPKHVDVTELLTVLDFREVPVPHLRPERPSPGVEVFRPDVPDFVLVHFTGGGEYGLGGPAIAICTDGSAEISGAAGAVTLSRGESVYVTPDEGRLTVTGGGELFLATTG